MMSLLKIGLTLTVLSVVMLLIHDAGADDDVKRKRVIIKVPHRIKHIYHHHTKKVHVHKVAKKKKPHKHVHVVVEEEEIVHPKYKSLMKNKGRGSWGDWQKPSGFKHSAEFEEGSHSEDYSFEDELDTKESRPHVQETSHIAQMINVVLGKLPTAPNAMKSEQGLKGRPKGRQGRSRYPYSAPKLLNHHEGRYHEVHHHQIDHEEDDYARKRRINSGPPSYSNKGVHGNNKHHPRPNPTNKFHHEDSYLPSSSEEYDELFDRGPTYPERKEDPSWLDYNRMRNPNVRDTRAVWTLPNVPQVNEYIEDNDTYDPGVKSGPTGGFYPSAFIPITTITSSVVQNSPPNEEINVPFLNRPSVQLTTERQPIYVKPTWKTPSVPKTTTTTTTTTRKPLAIRGKTKTKKNPGYTSQISQTPQGMTVKYQSHIGHSSDDNSPSSSFQSFSLLS